MLMLHSDTAAVAVYVPQRDLAKMWRLLIFEK